MSLRSALGFLTPIGGAAPPSPRALAWFPPVGAAIGAALGGLWWGSAQEWRPLVAASLVVVADLALTGMLHFDGLVDAADGLLAHLERSRRLEVMREPGAGAFGVAAAAGLLIARWAALATTAPSVLLLAGLWCASRTWMVAITLSMPYARAEGLASGFLGGALWARAAAVGGFAASAAMLVAWRAWPGAAVLGSATVAAAGVAALARKRVGGFTGDVLGAAGVLGETVGLVVASVRW